MISLQTIPTYMVAGYYLAFFFSLSHNFEGVHMQSDTTRPSNKGSMEHSFLYKQVRVIKRIQDSSTKNFTEIMAEFFSKTSIGTATKTTTLSICNQLDQ